jgi:large subunit ribosomal protein L23
MTDADKKAAPEKTGAKATSAPKKNGAAKKRAPKKTGAKGGTAAKAGSIKSAAASAQRLMQVLLAPQISEKSTMVGEKNNQYVFRVASDATKPEIKLAVELMFKKKVKGVQVANVAGKEKRFGRFMGKRRSWKKAYVSLMPGEEITFQGTE